MAKQTRIPGTKDEVPAEVQQSVDDYVKALRTRQKAQEKENTLRAEVLALFHEHDIEEVEIDDEKVLRLEGGDEKLKIKKRTAAKAKGEGDGNGDDE